MPSPAADPERLGFDDTSELEPPTETIVESLKPQDALLIADVQNDSFPAEH